MNRIIPVAIALIHKNNQYLLTERKGEDKDDAEFGRIWHFPGGAVEFGEEIHEALKREIKEELNLEILIEHQIPHVFSAVRPHWHGILISHVCSIIGTETIQLDSESFQYGWFTYDEIKKLYTLPFVIDMLDEALKLLEKR